MIGTIVNTLAILLGSTIGLLLGSRFPKKIQNAMLQVIPLGVLILGIQMTFKSQNFLVLMTSLALGTLIGEWIDIDSCMNRACEKISSRFSKGDTSKFTRAFIDTSLIYCVGALAILGALDEGLKNDPSLLFTKSFLDGVSSIFFAATMGVGVIFSAITVFLYQALITLLAQYIAPYLTLAAIAELTGIGGTLLVALGLTILKIKEFKIANLLPALPISVLLTLAGWLNV